MNKTFFIIGIASLLLKFGLLSADVPNYIDYQGRLTDSSDEPLDGDYSIVFSIYDVDTGGAALWYETQSVSIEDGLFQVVLGSDISLPVDLFDCSELWIGINVESDGEMTPRTRIQSVAYARNSQDVFGSDINPASINIEGYGAVINNSGEWTGETIPVYAAGTDKQMIYNDNGNYAGTDIYYDDSSGNTGVGTTNPDYRLHIEGSESDPLVYVNKTGYGRGMKVRTSSACAIWVENSGNHGLRITQADGDGVHITNADGDGIEVESAGEFAGKFIGDGYFSGNLGLGTTTPGYKLDVYGNYGWHAPHNFQMLGDGEFSFDFADADGNDYWHIWDSTHQSILAVRNNGMVGIGTNEPEQTLHVNDYMRLEPVSDPPDTPSAGDIYFDSDDNKLKCFDGSQWQNCW